MAQGFVGVKEIRGTKDNSQIVAMPRLDQKRPENDEVPWCSAFMNDIAWLLRLPRSKSLHARSWLLAGRPVALEESAPVFDVVILKRGGVNQPGPEVIEAKGLVGLYAGHKGMKILLLAGNQSDAACVPRSPVNRLLGFGRLV